MCYTQGAELREVIKKSTLLGKLPEKLFKCEFAQKFMLHRLHVYCHDKVVKEFRFSCGDVEVRKWARKPTFIMLLTRY